MRRFSTIAVLALLLLPSVAAAQIRMRPGVGVTTPIGALSDIADVGWHAKMGFQLGFATLPIALRADGTYHAFGQADPAPKLRALDGALSLVVELPGIGLVPYFLGGYGTYRFDADGFDADTYRGFHGAFGVDIGALGFGGYGEVRLAVIDGDVENYKLVTATLGIRL